MNKIFGSLLLAAALATSSAASAADLCMAPVRHHVVHHYVHHRASYCHAKKVVQTPTPKVVEEKPAEHVTTLTEKVIVKHEIIELPAHVVVVRPRCPRCTAPVPLPRRHARLSCCPPGERIPGLPPCRANAGRWRAVENCLARLGFAGDEFYSQPGRDGTDHARLTPAGYSYALENGLLGAARRCAAMAKVGDY